MFRQKIKIDKATKSDSTLFYLASKNSHLQVVKYLIENGADFKVENSKGQTSLGIALLNIETEVIKCQKSKMNKPNSSVQSRGF